MALFVFDILVFMALPYLLWRLVRGVAPMAVMPILVGLLIAVGAHHFDFDKNIVGPSPLGETIGWIGVLVLTFSAGLETRVIADGPKTGGQLFLSAAAALALPFGVGFLLALSGLLDGVIAPPADVGPLLSASAIGLCVAVSALPVLVGVVRELPTGDRATGNLALRIAALDDAILWVGLAVLLFLHAGQTGGFLETGYLGLGAVGVFAAMAIARRRLDAIEPHFIVAVGIGAAYLAAGAWATSVLGLHELLGAYFGGALAPAGIARKIGPERLGSFALFGLAPLFFGHRGLSIDGSVLTPAALGVALLLLVVAAGAKLAALHMTPPDPAMSSRERTRLGLLLQCKGLMEIVAASMLFKAGLVSPTTFAILVTLAIVSTIVTMPLFRFVSSRFAAKAAQPG